MPVALAKDDPVLVTGAGGFVGSVVARQLLERGFLNIRCVVRSSAGDAKLAQLAEAFPQAKLWVIKGNLLSREDCRRAADGTALVYHLATGTGKSFPGCVLDSTVATRNLLDTVADARGLRRFVNVSSFAVYSNMGLRRGAVLDETCLVERSYRERFDAYGYAKTKQDDLVVSYGLERGLRYTILRPGVVFGPGRAGSILGRCGVDTFGFFMHVTGQHQIPLTYVDNCAEAIVMAGLADGADGEVFNVVDDDLPSSSQLLRAVKRNLGRFFSVRAPYRLFLAFCVGWEKYSAWSEGQLPPVFNRRMCAAYHKGNQYTNEKLKRLIGWTPRVPMEQALARYFAYMKQAGQS